MPSRTKSMNPGASKSDRSGDSPHTSARSRSTSVPGRFLSFEARFAKPAVLASVVALAAPLIGGAQECKRIAPAGEGLDDSIRINECLRTEGRAKLKKGTFRLFGPIVFPAGTKSAGVSGVKLTGRGAEKTKLSVKSDCANPWPFVEGQDPGQYQPAIQVVRSPAAIVKKLEIDLSELRRDCGHLGNYTVLVSRSPGSRIAKLRIIGSRYGTAEYTSGGANGGGIIVANSEDSVVEDNTVEDVGFTLENGGSSAGYAAISIANSGAATVRNNRIMRAAFGITISNSSPQHGFLGDSSGTTVSGNVIVGAARVDCPECSQGRAIKLQACGVGDEPPLSGITVAGNSATEFGGANGIQAGSGLDLICGVQYSRFENNGFTGASTAEFGLQIRSSFLSPASTTHHNTFLSNTFLSGRGTPACNGECADVNFTRDGPDQIGLRRNGRDRSGTNIFGSVRAATDRGCNDYSHAFFSYRDDKDFVRHRQFIWLAASGVRPFSAVTFRFRRAETGEEVAIYNTGVARNNCVVNQEEFHIDPTLFPRGFYDVWASYQDGNSDAAIDGDFVGTIRVRGEKSN